MTKHTTNQWSRWQAISLAIAASALAGYGAWSLTADERDDRRATGHARQLSSAFRYAAREVLPSVVTIQKVVRESSIAETTRPKLDDRFRGTPLEDMLRDFLESQPSRPREGPIGMGSGVIIDSAGIILTNNHVVAGAGDVLVRLSDGREFNASKVKTDPRTDLAVVWIEADEELRAARLGDSDAMEIGDWVLAVGHPFGMLETVTAGIISAKGRGLGVAAREEFLQTDAAINPGNSGGPLIDLDGQVIGINTAISSRNGGYQGAGFAVPVNLARWVIRQLVETGSVRRAYLGTQIGVVTQKDATRLGVPVGSGTLIGNVAVDSPAAEAGLRPDDVVVGFANKPVTNSGELVNAVEKSEIGSRQPIEIIRDGKRMTLQVNIRLQPENYGTAHFAARGEGAGAVFKELGLEVQPLTPDVASALGLEVKQGVVITAIDRRGPAGLVDLKPGSVITRVNRKAIRSLADFREAVRDFTETGRVRFTIHDERGSKLVEIQARKAER